MSGTDPTTVDGIPRWKRALTWIERLALLVLTAFAVYRLAPQAGALTGIGPDRGRAPDFMFVSLGGDTIRSADLRGDVVVLNFWATWCVPCRLEMPSLQSLHEDREADGVHVLGLATDVGSEDAIRAFLDAREISYPVGRATTGLRRAFGGIRGIPTTFLVGRDGLVEHRVVGYFAPPALRLAVHRLLEDTLP